jgi:hypothetical protein
MLQPLIFLLIVYTYVAFRNKQPDEETWKEVKEKLEYNEIDINQLVEWKADDCKLGVGIPLVDILLGNVTQTLPISNILDI